MTILELGNILKGMYETKNVKKTTMIHLFGVIYADEIHNAEIKSIEIVKAAKIPDSYSTEVNKGMNLSKYVELKQEYIGYFQKSDSRN
jgi:hypothetical protein